ncbi:hypothetical protein OG500_30215 [Kitasatospora sp. NBC_01250]|uniref:hypothetical protein n=1 Tax=Kitasatospora sp. NBC_01250 TaxID=2903571 RepID=UPI002E30F354|nr:hypothetical protein [Kitasatospora sp. NBC_01250]
MTLKSQLSGGDKVVGTHRLEQTTQTTDIQERIFKNCGIPMPAKLSGLTTTG